MKRRPTKRRRLGVTLCALTAAAGCSQYLARHEVPAIASTPAKTVSAAPAAPAAPNSAAFEVEAVQSALATASPHCPAVKPVAPDALVPAAVTKAPDPPDQGTPGICVLTTSLEAKAAVPPAGAPAPTAPPQ
jgi:hypothetical protein